MFENPWPNELEIVEQLQQLESANEATQAVSSVQGICQFEVYHLHRDSPMSYYRDTEFKDLFGYTKEHFLDLLNIFGKDIERPRQHYSAEIRLATHLLYLRSNGFYKNVSNHHGFQFHKGI